MFAIGIRAAALNMFFASLLFAASNTWAANINNIIDGKHCAIKLEGELVPGDADRFAEIASKIEITDGESSEGISSDRALCLNSLGGNYLEGRKIAQIVHDKGLTTRIEALSACYSSCALIFMAGRVNGAESESISRYLHVEGKLGFHAPYFDLAKDETITGEQAGYLVQISSGIIAEFVSFSSVRSQFDINPMMSSSLLAEMLATGPDEVSIVDTVEKAARWNIMLDGIQPNKQIDKKGMITACLNFQSWLADEPSNLDSLAYYLSNKEGS